MSTTIQKRADELKPGDVIEVADKGACSVLYFARREHALDDEFQISFGRHATGSVFTAQVNPACIFYTVRSLDLTPAQQHAEELRDTLRNLVDALDNGVMYHAHASQPMKDAEALLAKIDPPVPPTLEETLAALDLAVSDANVKHPDIAPGLAILDRARRSGLLK